MKLASLKKGGLDGTLVVVNRLLTRAIIAGSNAPSLRSALDNWKEVEPHLRYLYAGLEGGNIANAFDLDFSSNDLGTFLNKNTHYIHEKYKWIYYFLSEEDIIEKVKLHKKKIGVWYLKEKD